MSACPRKVRGACGTENKDIADMQSVLTNNGTFVYGASTGNQRIEAFWRHLRMECCQFWIEFFGHEFSGDIIDKNLVQCVFMNFVQVRLVVFLLFEKVIFLDKVAKYNDIHNLYRPLSFAFLR